MTERERRLGPSLVGGRQAVEAETTARSLTLSWNLQVGHWGETTYKAAPLSSEREGSLHAYGADGS